jgi:hypothetical protein
MSFKSGSKFFEDIPLPNLGFICRSYKVMVPLGCAIRTFFPSLSVIRRDRDKPAEWGWSAVLLQPLWNFPAAQYKLLQSLLSLQLDFFF